MELDDHIQEAAGALRRVAIERPELVDLIRKARQRGIRRQRTFAFAAVALIIGSAIGLLQAGGPLDDKERVLSTESGRVGSDVELFLPDKVVSTRGGFIAFSVLNRKSQPISFGLGVALDRWNGEAWIERHVLEADRYAETIHRKAPDGDIRLPRLDAGAHASGGLEVVFLPQLERGRYRLRLSILNGEHAVGVFRVAERENRIASIDLTSPVVISPSQAVVHTRASDVVLELAQRSGESAPPIQLEAKLERRTTNKWQTESIVRLENVIPGSSQYRAFLPNPLKRGSYRFVAVAEDGTTVSGPLWVVAKGDLRL